MSTYSNRLQPDLQNLLQRVVRFFHQRSSCTTMHISADVQRITLNALCMMISGERTKQLDIFFHITGFTSDFVSFRDVELIRFFHGALQLQLMKLSTLRIHCFLYTSRENVASSHGSFIIYLTETITFYVEKQKHCNYS